jgi:hypothetical protein
VRLKRARAVATKVAVLRARGNGRRCGDFVGLPAVRRVILKTVFEEKKPRMNTDEHGGGKRFCIPPWVLRETPRLKRRELPLRQRSSLSSSSGVLSISAPGGLSGHPRRESQWLPREQAGAFPERPVMKRSRIMQMQRRHQVVFIALGIMAAGISAENWTLALTACTPSGYTYPAAYGTAPSVLINDDLHLSTW